LNELISNAQVAEQMIKLGRTFMLSNFLLSIIILYQEGVFNEQQEENENGNEQQEENENGSSINI